MCWCQNLKTQSRIFFFILLFHSSVLYLYTRYLYICCYALFVSYMKIYMMRLDQNLNRNCAKFLFLILLFSTLKILRKKFMKYNSRNLTNDYEKNSKFYENIFFRKTREKLPRIIRFGQKLSKA